METSALSPKTMGLFNAIRYALHNANPNCTKESDELLVSFVDSVLDDVSTVTQKLVEQHLGKFN